MEAHIVFYCIAEIAMRKLQKFLMGERRISHPKPLPVLALRVSVIVCWMLVCLSPPETFIPYCYGTRLHIAGREGRPKKGGEEYVLRPAA